MGVVKKGGAIVESLKQFRQEHGLSQSKMAEKLGVSKSFYEKVEYGQRSASREFLLKFKAAFPAYDMNIFFDSAAHGECREEAPA